jgi:hypothetical protein
VLKLGCRAVGNSPPSREALLEDQGPSSGVTRFAVNKDRKKERVETDSSQIDEVGVR